MHRAHANPDQTQLTRSDRMTTLPNPFADFTKMFEQFKLPGMDMAP